MAAGHKSEGQFFYSHLPLRLPSGQMWDQGPRPSCTALPLSGDPKRKLLSFLSITAGPNHPSFLQRAQLAPEWEAHSRDFQAPWQGCASVRLGFHLCVLPEREEARLLKREGHR